MDAIKTLTQSNKQLAKMVAILAKENENLHALIEWLTTGLATQHNKLQNQGKQLSYCWIHGFVVENNHDSKTCNYKAQGILLRLIFLPSFLTGLTP